MAAAAPAEGTAALAVQDDSVDPHGVPLDMMPPLRQFLHGPNMPRTTAEERRLAAIINNIAFPN